MLVYLCFIICSPLFTMFEFTKLIYLWRCIFIHLYFYFCTMFFFLVSFLYLVCKFFYGHITIVVTTGLFLFFRELMICQSDPSMWTCAELACGPTYECITVHLNLIPRLGVNTVSQSWQLWSSLCENFRKRVSGTWWYLLWCWAVVKHFSDF